MYILCLKTSQSGLMGAAFYAPPPSFFFLSLTRWCSRALLCSALRAFAQLLIRTLYLVSTAIRAIQHVVPSLGITSQPDRQPDREAGPTHLHPTSHIHKERGK